MNDYHREELIGRSIFELGIWANPAAGRRMRRLLEKNGVVRNFNYRFRRKSGEMRHGLVSASIIYIRGHRHILSEAVDTTELRKAEQSLRKARCGLEHRVKERTLELQKMKDELDEANTALRVLLRKCDQERIELEEKVFCNAKRLILPYVKKLKRLAEVRPVSSAPGQALSWKRPGLKLSAKGAGLAAAILEERNREDVL